ncbi:MAG: FHA domain-containing protein [Tannerella sp.]|jgi:DNA-directed RNA polymerase subunit M/transcription elongation factor TFIIS|nr:FHA domain-containing protein [Tannerella sp.]
MSKVSVRCPGCNTGLSVNKTSENQALKCPKCGFQSILSQFPEVTPKKIVCPACKVVLTIDPNYAGKLTCPKCQYNNETSAFPEYCPPKPDPNGNKQDGSIFDTLPPEEQQDGKLIRPGILRLVESDVPCGDRKIILKKGRNVIGRKAPNSSATIQLDTTDSFISRQHACIELVENPDKSLEHLLSDTGSVNGTFHNREKTEKGDIVILTPGDTIRLGHTTFQFTLD